MLVGHDKIMFVKYPVHLYLNLQMKLTESKLGLLQVSSVSKSCLTLCDSMNCSTSGFSVHHQLLELAQTHVYQIDNAIQASHPLSSPSPAFNLSQHQALFQWVSSLHQVAKILRVSGLASVLPIIIQDPSPSGWTGWISLQSKGLSRVFSNTQFKSINSLVLSFLYSPTLTSIHDHWNNHSFHWLDLCWQKNVSAF